VYNKPFSNPNRKQTMRNAMNFIDDEAAYEAAIKRKIKNAANAKFLRENPDGYDVVAFLADASSWSEFAKSLHNSYEDRGTLSIGQMAAARSMIAKAQARKAERLAARNAPASVGHHVSTVGQREVFTITINKLMEMEGMYGTTYIHICADANGNVIVYKGSSELGEPGDTVVVKATVKEHTAYNGVAQTIINRPKVQ
jgi:hypothetical protein